MSRAFVNEDRPDEPPKIAFGLPPVDDPGYETAAALALLEAAKVGDTAAGEAATGFRWGEPQLRPHVRALLEKEQERAEEEQDRRFVQVARRFLRA
ncbi:MAG TPA: hypothetical protein VMK65_12880 [Longimicrobiales bacterium]|nr:hypothetical protein [Longimicrobiales bacterium]